MQVAGGAPLIAVGLDICGLSPQLLERLTRSSWHAFWIGNLLGFGVAATQMVFVQRDYGPAMQEFAYKMKWGVAELVVFAVSLWFYVWGWQRLRSTRGRRGAHIVIGLVAATNLLYHFPSLMLMFSRATAGRMVVGRPVDAEVYRQIAFQGDILVATVHFWLASLVAGGVTLALLATDGASEDTNAEHGRVGVWSASIALVAALLQLPVGFWLVAVLPDADQSQLLGNDLWALGLLLVAFFAALGLMHELASMAFGSCQRSSANRSAMKLIVVVLAMVGVSVRLGG